MKHTLTTAQLFAKLARLQRIWEAAYAAKDLARTSRCRHAYDRLHARHRPNR